MVWYTGVDQQRYDAGEKFLPQDRFLLNYTSPTTGTEEEEQVTTSQGIPNTNAFINAGGGGSNMGGLNQTWFTEPGAPATSQGDYDIYGNKINELGRTGILGAWDKTKDFLFRPRVRGTLGDRLEGQYQTGQKFPSWIAAIAGAQSPFNPDSRNWNPEMASQLNFLEGGTGGKWTGTGNNLTWTGDQMMIGRDPNSGQLKYGAGSVLEGKNVISGFGSNDYEEALNNYISKMQARQAKAIAQGRQLTAFQQKKLKQAQDELGGWKGEQKIQDADKNIIHTDTGKVTDIITGQAKGGGADVWQETFSGTQDGSGEFAGTGNQGNQGGVSSSWSGYEGNPHGEWKEGGRVYLNLGGLASIL
tara:strand:+ start:695 stop:1771 length:1077 start_codon:yes stop_codon:yes gene_type:complete